jgi:hypothetical protein
MAVRCSDLLALFETRHEQRVVPLTALLQVAGEHDLAGIRDAPAAPALLSVVGSCDGWPVSMRSIVSPSRPSIG